MAAEGVVRCTLAALEGAARVVASALADPLRALVEPEKRVFWPHLVASAIVVAFVWARGPRRRSLLAALASPRLWLHRSAREDYLLFVVRGVLRLTLFAPFAIAAVPLAARLAARLTGALGASPVSGVSHGAALALFTSALFVVEDCSRFLFHYATHRVGWLWELHRVHHAAEVLTPFTLYRVHPVEGLLNRLRGALTTALVAGVFAWLFPGKVRGLEILGVDAFGFLWSFAGANLRHSHVWIGYGPRVERWLLSPAQHQVHHSVEPRHHDRNFGTALAVWDRLFGTLYVPASRERITVGLRGDAPRGGLVALVVRPLARALRRLVPFGARDLDGSAAASVGSPAE
jgi:sterol desaturase/sphingolipid hydroxylase (fatty acid hydroxylase superfamily)